jgi:hypothetical protein
MPFVLPTIPFTVGTTFPLTGFIARQAAFTAGGLARLDASIAGLTPAGGAATTTSLGAVIGAAPARTRLLVVNAATTSAENGLVEAAIGTAQASAQLSIFVEEFSAAGAFIRGVPGPPTVVFDAAAFFIGFHIRVGETQARTAAMLMPIVPGNIYRIWLDSLQFVNTVGAPIAGAVSNFTYDFGPMFFAFV